MKCWKCGADVEDGDLYCGVCGANLHQGPQAPPGPDSGWNSGDRPRDPGWQSSNSGGEFLLKGLTLVCAVFYGSRAVLSLLAMVRNLLFGYLPWFSVLRTVFFGGLSAALGGWMCAVLVMLAFRRTQRNSDGLLLCLFCGAAGLILTRLLGLLVNVAVYPGSFSYQLQTLLTTVLGAAITVGGVCLILRFALGELPFAGKGPEDLQDTFREAFSSLGQAAGDAGAQNQQNPYSQQNPYGAQDQQNPCGQQNPYGPQGDPGCSPFRLKTDRSLPLYIILSLVTCGIYAYYTIYAMARDVNAACHGDGQHTPGLLQFILLSIVTCGIYAFYWYYSLGNRLFNNGPRYGLQIQETGTTILLWMLVGLIFCGIGHWVALYFLFRSLNAVCAAYNYNHGY